MGIKFEINFIMVAWAFVPCLMFATKVFRMDAKDRHGLDMRMKHHSSFWVKGNILVDGIERVVLSQAGEENVLRGITVKDEENAAAHALARNGKAFPSTKLANMSKLTYNMGIEVNNPSVLVVTTTTTSEAEDGTTTSTTTTSPAPSIVGQTMAAKQIASGLSNVSSDDGYADPARVGKFAVAYALGTLEGASVVGSTVYGQRNPNTTAKALASAGSAVVPEDDALLLIPSGVWREAERTFRKIQQNKAESRVSFFH